MSVRVRVRGERFVAAVKAWRPGGVDIVLDPVGASYLADNQRVLATDGRLVLIGLLGGPSLLLPPLLLRRPRTRYYVGKSVVGSRGGIQIARIPGLALPVEGINGDDADGAAA